MVCVLGDFEIKEWLINVAKPTTELALAQWHLKRSLQSVRSGSRMTDGTVKNF
jgi:hypothetical protein